MNDDLFSHAFETTQAAAFQPLAERMRPHSHEEYLGRPQLQRFLKADVSLPSLILWGPPGSGKTTFAHLLARAHKYFFVALSAVDAGAVQLREAGDSAKLRLFSENKQTLLFVDEIHRLNRNQQDCLLPYVEKGFVVLVGATTENPSFELTSALLSRCQVIRLEALDVSSVEKIVQRALKQLAQENFDFDVAGYLAARAQGDARRALNELELIIHMTRDLGTQEVTQEFVEKALQAPPIRYDKSRDQHYDTISAFIKSIRGSDPDAAAYYLARMIRAGESPLFIARRLVILASEDVGNADPRALTVAVAAMQATDFVGVPEAWINISQAVTYLASAPKSNASYKALREAQALAEKAGHLEIPLSIRNAPTTLMKKEGYGKEYGYAHDYEGGISEQEFFPDKLRGTTLYQPSDRGYEKNIKAYLEWVRQLRQKP